MNPVIFESLTIQEALAKTTTAAGYFVYAVKDGSDWLYIGRSTDPFTRLYQHLGLADAWGKQWRSADDAITLLQSPALSAPLTASSIGGVVYHCRPESLQWAFCVSSIVEAYPNQETLWEHLTDTLERDLIQQHAPYFNDTHNSRPRPTPSKYIKHPDSSSSLFLNI